MNANSMKMGFVTMKNVVVYCLKKHGGEVKTAQLINGQNNKTVYISSRR